MRRARKPHAELAVLLVCALAAYAFTDYITIGGAQLSAILSSFFSGITMRHYAFYNLSRRAQARDLPHRLLLDLPHRPTCLTA